MIQVEYEGSEFAGYVKFFCKDCYLHNPHESPERAFYCLYLIYKLIAKSNSQIVSYRNLSRTSLWLFNAVCDFFLGRRRSLFMLRRLGCQCNQLIFSKEIIQIFCLFWNNFFNLYAELFFQNGSINSQDHPALLMLASRLKFQSHFQKRPTVFRETWAYSGDSR